MKNLIIIAVILVIVKINLNSQTQSDTSDTYWEVVMPVPAAPDIDMKQVLVGTTKDSLVSVFISNIGSWKFRVDSIYFIGADATVFSIVSGFPKYEILAGNSKPAEFRFSPTEARIYNAEIVIITQADTIYKKITGEGVKQSLEVLSRLIDFGAVDIGKYKDTLKTLTIKNIGSTPLTITETKHNYPNITDFSTISGGGSFTLQPDETRLMDLRFTPSDVGRTSGTLEFHYKGVGSPAVIQLFGQGNFAGKANATIKTPVIEAYPGEEIQVPVILHESTNLNFSGTTGIRTDLIFNPTLLNPIELPFEMINDFEAKLTLEKLPVNKKPGDTLGIIRFFVGLGNAERCGLNLINSEAMGGAAEISFINGSFRLLGICYDGGPRLINPSSIAGIINISPNPADNTIEIEISASEVGRTELCVYNCMGEKVKILFSEILQDKKQFLLKEDISGLPSGQYFLVFRTPTLIENKQIIVIK